MGPLVPDIISPDFSLIVAIFLGFGFGFALEQAGFSTTHKLVGLFYGYDFTVLRVFFTAGVTAMTGVLILGHVGLLDLSLIYVNPTFLRSALVGGLVMGAGFIIGGFCPGTSICAAATGKLDAMVFILGSVIGIFGFAELYPLLKHFYAADNWGAPRINETLGMSPALFAALLTAVAAGAFYFVGNIQNRVTKTPFTMSRKQRIQAAVAVAVPLVLIAITAITPDYRQAVQNKIAEAERLKKCKFKEISADRLADELMNNAFVINLIDVRSKEAFAAGHLPLAINIPLDHIFNREWETIFNQHHKKNIFYADDVNLAKKACLSTKFIGSSENYVLSQTMAEFNNRIFKAKPPGTGASKKDLETFTFRSHAGKAILELDQSLSRLSQPVQKKIVKAKGGCS